METVSVLLTPCEGNLLERVSNAELWCQSKQAVKQIVKMLVIWDAMTLIGRKCNAPLIISYPHAPSYYNGKMVVLRLKFL